MHIRSIEVFGESTFKMMDTSKVSEMWNQLNIDRFLHKNSTLSQCEAELKELMRQIDIVNQNKKAEWLKEKQALAARLEARERDNLILSATLEEKHQEIGDLRLNQEFMERQQKDLTTKYEMQLNKLREQVAHMQRNYKHKLQQAKADLPDTRSDELEADVRKLLAKVEDYDQRLLECEQEKRVLLKQLDSVELQNKSLGEKCDFLSRQLSFYRTDLDKRHDISGGMEGSLKSECEQLRIELEQSQSTINTQNVQICKLKAIIEEFNLAHQQLEAELRKSELKIRKLEDEAREACGAISARDQLLKANDEEHIKLNCEILQLRHSIQEKDNKLQLLERSSRDPRSSLSKLQEELSRIKSETEGAKETEKALRDEVSQLHSCLDQSNAECDHLSNELKRKVNELKNMETAVRKQLSNENSKLREEIFLLKESHRLETDAIKKTEAKLNDEISSKSISIRSLNERILRLQEQLQEEAHKEDAKVQVANAKLHAVQLEISHLRLKAGLNEAVSGQHLEEIQSAYSESVKTLEERNLQLEKELSHLKDKLQKMEESAVAKTRASFLESETKIQQKADEVRQTSEMAALSKRQVESVESRLRVTIEQYETKLEELRKKLFFLETELEMKNHTLAKLGRRNEAMSSYVTGVNRIVQNNLGPALWVEDTCEDKNSQELITFPVSKENNLLQNDHLDPADIEAQDFLQQQEEKCVELNNLISFHIEEMQAATYDMIK